MTFELGTQQREHLANHPMSTLARGNAFRIDDPSTDEMVVDEVGYLCTSLVRRLRLSGAAGDGSPFSSVVVCTAIDVDRLAGDEVSIITDQKQAGRRNLIDGALPAKRDAGGVRQVASIPLRIVASCIDAPRRDRRRERISPRPPRRERSSALQRPKVKPFTAVNLPKAWPRILASMAGP